MYKKRSQFPKSMEVMELGQPSERMIDPILYVHRVSPFFRNFVAAKKLTFVNLSI